MKISLKKLKLKNRFSIVYVWLLSYLLVLAVPVVITIITYGLTADVVEKEVNNSNEFFLQGVQKQIDEVFINAEQLTRELSLNPNVLEILRIQNNNGEISPYEIYKAVNELKVLGITDPSIETFYICFSDLDLIFSPETSNTSGTFYVVYMKEAGIDYSQWKLMTSGRHSKTYITPSESIQGNNNIVYFIQTIPMLIKSRTYANIIVKVDSSRFVQYEKEIQSAYDGSLLILDSYDAIIMSSEKLPEPYPISYASLGPGSGVTHVNIDGGNFMLSHMDSELGDFKYITLVPEKIFWEKASYVKRTAIISLVLCLVLGGSITAFALKKNYNPIKQLVSFLENHNDGSQYDKKSDEYSFIRDTIVQVKNEKEKTDSILNQQKNVLKTEFLNRLLKGTTGKKLPMNEVLSFYDIRFCGDFFAVMVFYLEDFDEAFYIEAESGQDDSDKETFRLIKFTVSSVIERLIGSSNGTHVIGSDDILILLLNFSDIHSSKKAELARISSEAARVLKERYNIELSVAISNVHQSIEGIPSAYTEALQVMEYKKLLDAEQILHYDDISDIPRGDYYYPLELEYKLINHIKTGDYEKSKQIIDDVFKKNFENNTLSTEISRCLMFDLVSTMIKTIDEINKTEHKEFIESQNTIDKLLHCKNIASMKEELEKTLSNFCDYVRENNGKKTEDMKLIEKAKQYVTTNYHDYNLSVNSVADTLTIHPVYLSKVYKELTGEGLHDYINRFRTEKAKHLLQKKTFHNLEDVANAVGFTNTRTFTRAFKRCEGITPGKYKKI